MHFFSPGKSELSRGRNMFCYSQLRSQKKRVNERPTKEGRYFNGCKTYPLATVQRTKNIHPGITTRHRHSPHSFPPRKDVIYKKEIISRENRMHNLSREVIYVWRGSGERRVVTRAENRGGYHKWCQQMFYHFFCFCLTLCDPQCWQNLYCLLENWGFK